MTRLKPSLHVLSRATSSLMVCAIVALGAAQAQPAQRASCLPLSNAILSALEFDPRIQRADADRDVARANTLSAHSRNLPQVSLFGRTGRGDNPQLGPSQQDQLGIQAQQEIYSFGARRFATDAAKARADAADIGFHETQSDIAQGVALSFLDLQRSEQLLSIRWQQERAYAEDAKSAASRLSRNVITLTDASQIRARFAVARSQRINAEVAYDTARTRLSVLTNRPIGCLDFASAERFVGKDAARLMALPVGRAVDEAYARALSLRRAKAQIQAARATMGEASRANMPVISGYAFQVESYNRAFDSNLPRGAFNQEFSDDTRIGLNINQQLFTGGRNSARQADARARLKGAQADEGLERLILEDLVTRSLAQAKAQQRAGLSLLEAKEQAQIQLTNTTREYDRGTKTLTDLVLANESFYSAAAQETEARFQFYSSLIRVYGAMGMLTEGLTR